MSFDRWVQWIGILANIGVLLGFLAVAYQLQLSRQSIQLASNLERSAIAANAEVALMGDTGYDAYAKSLTNPSEMTEGELVQLWTYLSIAQTTTVQAYVDYTEGRITERNWHIARDGFLNYFNYPMGLVWFEETARVYDGSELEPFYQEVREVIERSPKNQTGEWFERMHEEAKKLKPAQEN